MPNRDIIRGSAKSLEARSFAREREMKGIVRRIGFFSALVFGFAFAVAAQEATKHAITFDDMIKMHRIAEPQISPDGKWVAYTMSTPDMDANRGVSNIWIVSTTGGAPMQLTQSGHDNLTKTSKVLPPRHPFRQRNGSWSSGIHRPAWKCWARWTFRAT